MNRRAYLMTAATVATAGCSLRESGVAIDAIKGFNLHDSPHTFRVAVHREDATVYEGSFDLASTSAPDEETTFYVDERLPDTAAEYVVELQNDSAEPKSYDIAPKAEMGSVTLLVNISQEDTVELYLQESESR
ncbi:hypothetical protein BRD04_01855 [Halobacteriales archaeon QS_9_67_17]|nr:MAG: hypothetical protein BRD04_01855 [Halobacteriales archaeon QS_9_67_17]